ncbi:uncharacterized protein TNCV_2331211 [Trichonephila clavipes]|nr:uncharacterized protein TNCV_2331211 [Trichonephila clavipes]
MATPPKTTLTVFFQLCQNDAFAKTLLYVDVPRYYTWNVSLKEWKRRVQGTHVNGWPGLNCLDGVLNRYPSKVPLHCDELPALLVIGGGIGLSCQVIYSQFGLAIHQNDHQARRRFVEWAQNEIAVVPNFHKRILFSDEAHFWLNGYVNKQNCRIWSEANPQVYVETPLHPEKLTVWCALWAGGILLQKR